MKNKKLNHLIIILYILILLTYPYILKIDVSNINNSSLPVIDKILKNINLIPFVYNYNINSSIIIKNILIKLVLFIPLGISLKHELTFKKALLTIILIGLTKEILHLITLVGYFDITDILLYITGFLIGWSLKRIY